MGPQQAQQEEECLWELGAADDSVQDGQLGAGAADGVTGNGDVLILICTTTNNVLLNMKERACGLPDPLNPMSQHRASLTHSTNGPLNQILCAPSCE